MTQVQRSSICEGRRLITVFIALMNKTNLIKVSHVNASFGALVGTGTDVILISVY